MIVPRLCTILLLLFCQSQCYGIQEEKGYTTPFYIYQDNDWDRLIEGCVPPSGDADAETHYHSEHLAIMQLRRHQWRVFNPEEALIFVIPLMLGTASVNSCSLPLRNISERASLLLWSSEYFQRYKGSDHLLINTSWRVRRIPPPLAQLMKNGTHFNDSIN
jgi:hypothetical protein